MSVPHQTRRSPVLVVLVALGTAGLAALVPDRSADFVPLGGRETGAHIEPLDDSPRLRTDLVGADRTVVMLQAMRSRLLEQGVPAHVPEPRPGSEGEAR